MVNSRDTPDRQLDGALDLNGWHEPTRRIRHLQLLQTIVLVLVCLASVVLVLVLGRGIVGAAEDQQRANLQLRELADIRALMLEQQATVWQRRAEGSTPASVELFLDFATFRAGALKLAGERAGGDGPEATAARAQVLENMGKLDALLASVAKDPNDPELIRKTLVATERPAQDLADGVERWLATTTAEINQATNSSRSLADRLLWWSVGLVGGLSLIGILLWFMLDRTRNRLTTMLGRSEERFRSLVQNSSDAVLVIDDAGAIRYASQPAQRLFGFPPAELVDRPLAELVHPTDMSPMSRLTTRGVSVLDTPDPIEWVARHRDGGPRAVESVAARRIDDPVIGGFVVNTRDVTERREMEQVLEHRAFHDALTDLANRALFNDRVEHALEVRTRQGGIVAILLMDLDDFKMVNDSLGHASGDALLVEVANRLRSALRSSDTPARLGGDEFAVLVETAADQDEVTRLADRIVQTLREPMTIAGREVVIQGSIGIAIAGGADATAASLLRDADVAMYAAKARGRAGYAVFDPKMSQRASDRLALTTDLHRALERDQLALQYQPIVDLRSGQMVGFEALVRWQHPTRGTVGPNDFIPIAEETGLIVPIGRWVLRTAVQGVATCQVSAHRGMLLSINVAMRQLEQHGFAEMVAAVLEEFALPPERLMLEITESELMRDSEASLRQLSTLKDLGVTIAIDDFGTGYSSLAYLATLPIDVVKIDRSFVAGLSSGQRDARIAGMIVGIGESLGLRTIAEGVEAPDQVTELRDLGCEIAQGFYYSVPVDADDLQTLLAADAPLSS